MNERQPAGTEAAQPQVAIHKIYLKDVSFECPNAPAVFQETEQPEIEVNLGVNTGQIAEDTHDVTLSVTVTAKVEDRIAFLVEIQQAGIFTLQGFGEENLAPMLGIYCPNTLFPYAREAVAALVAKGGFPQLMLEPVNFEAVYAEHLRQQTEAQAQPTH